MIQQSFSMDHVGWITEDLDLFEEFWCKRLGFEMQFESFLDSPRALDLFGKEFSGTIRRYKKGPMVVEIHHLDSTAAASQDFNRFGINHIALKVEDREAFLREINPVGEPQVPVHRYANPGGWFNLFIQDFEGNWIELRESLVGSNTTAGPTTG
jgi:catechol 2,3-dioxygenase-like lactoylglutathione lyase family enzyme